MRILNLGPVAILAVVLASCSSSAGGSQASSSAPSGQTSAGTQATAAPSGSSGGGGAASTAASQATGASAAASQATGGGGSSKGWAAKPCGMFTEAEVAGIIHGAMVATPQPVSDDITTAECEYASEESGNQVSISIAEGAAAKALFDGFAGGGDLGVRIDGLGDAAYYTDGSLSIWKGDTGVGIDINQSDATDDASLQALAVALGRIAVSRM